MNVWNAARMMATSGALAALMAVSPAMAQDTSKSAGDLMVRLRGIAVVPDDRAQIDVLGGNTELSNTVVPELDFTYFFTKNIGVELILATSPHDIEVKDTVIGDAEVGSAWLLPPTVTLQYHFMPDGGVSPYIGAGINFTYFYGIEDKGIVTDLDIDPTFGWALQAGVDFRVSGNWYANIDVKKVFMDADVEINNAIKAEVEMNPWIIGIGVGYKF